MVLSIKSKVVSFLSKISHTSFNTPHLWIIDLESLYQILEKPNLATCGTNMQITWNFNMIRFNKCYKVTWSPTMQITWVSLKSTRFIKKPQNDHVYEASVLQSMVVDGWDLYIYIRGAKFTDQEEIQLRAKSTIFYIGLHQKSHSCLLYTGCLRMISTGRINFPVLSLWNTLYCLTLVVWAQIISFIYYYQIVVNAN